MSNSWDPTPYQVQGGEGQPPSQVKLFDPNQFQGHPHQPDAAAIGDVPPQQNFQPPTSGAYFQPQQNQSGTWDSWGNWNWNSEGGEQPTGQNAYVGADQSGTPSDQQPPPQFASHNHEQSVDHSQPQNQFYNSQQYYNGGAAPEATPSQHGSYDSNSPWTWNAEQSMWVPTSTSGNDHTLTGQDAVNNQGQYFYQGQQPQYFDHSAWNSADPTQNYQWGGHVQADPQTSGQEGTGQFPPHENEPDPQVVSGQVTTQLPTNSAGSMPDAGAAFLNTDGSNNMIVSAPSVHVPEPVVSQNVSDQGHVRQSSIDSSASGTVAQFYGHGDEDVQDPPAQVQPSLPVPDSGIMQHLKVNPFQRTDSGISNASLQTVNLSADEADKDGVEEVIGQMESLQVNQGNTPADNKPHTMYSNSGDFSGFGNYNPAPQDAGASPEEAVSSGSGESDLQSPMMNDWEIVPPQAHSSSSHSRHDSLEDASSFSTKPPEVPSQSSDLKMEVKSPEATPEGIQSASTQDSESFTAISSTSSGEVTSSVPFSQGSSYHPTASSTPLTSPGGQSVLSQPSSLPSLQSSPQQAVDSSSAPVFPSSPGSREPTSKQDSLDRNLSSIKSTPEKEAKVSRQSREADNSLHSSAHSSGKTHSSIPSLVRGGQGSGKPPPAPVSHSSTSSQDKEGGQLSSPSRRHHSAFHPVHSQRAKHNMSPATTLWDNLDSAPTGNILLAPAVPLIIPSLGTKPHQASTTTVTSAISTVSTSSAQPVLRKSASDSNSLEKLALRDGGRRGRDRDGRYSASGKRIGERSMNKSEELARSREEDNRSLGSLDELDATPDFTDDSINRSSRSRGYGRDARDPRDNRDPRYDPYVDRPSSRSDSYREDYRKPKDPYRGYGYRDPYYDEKYDRPRSRQDEEKSSQPSSRSAKDMDRPRSRTEYERDRENYAQHRDHYRGGYSGYDGYGPHDYYYDDRERFYRYYRDSRYRHGYAEEMGQYYGGQQHPPHYDSRYAAYYGHHPPLPPLPQYPYEDFDRSSFASLSRGQTPAFDDADPSAQDYYGKSSRPSSRSEKDRDSYAQGYSGYGSGYDVYGGGYYDQYNYQYPYYNYQQPADQQAGGYQQGRMTPPKHILPHVRVCFSPTGQLITVLPTRPAEGQPATVEIHDLQVLLQDHPEVEELKAFPGPLVRNDTHKNDVLLYCQNKARECSENVDLLDRDSAELIWRLLELLLKQNGTIIGTDIADLLLAGHEPTTHEYKVGGMRIIQSGSSDPLGTPDREGDSGASSPAVRVSAERTIISAAQVLEESTDRFRHLLLYGRKKEALDWAMKHNLWGHALFLASKMDNRTYASIMTRFANTAMRMNDPLQTLYQLMSGRQPASVTNVVDERWGDWRPHLAMVLSNHSSRPDLDKKSIIALGDTLATKHCLHASHFCYLMAQVEFGSFFKKTSKIVLIGANHNLPLDEFYNNGSIQCTEVYEYAQTLGNSKFCLPQFQVYKFLYACRLVEYGLAQEAFHYFEVIASQVLLNPARFHPTFISILFSLSSQLKHGDPQKMHEGHDSADPLWLTQLSTICQGYEEGSIQFKSGSATPMTGYGGQTPSSESGELAAYGMDTSSMAGSAGNTAYPQDTSAYPQDTSSYANTSGMSHNYQQHGAGTAGQGDGTTQQAFTGTEQCGQYNQQASGEQYNWQQQQQQTQEQHHQPQQQYDASQYQQWQGNYDYSQSYGADQTQVTQAANTTYQSDNSQQGADPTSQHHHQQLHQPPATNEYNYNSYAPQQRPSLTSQGSMPEHTEGDDDDDDDEEDDDVDVTDASNFDYFGAVTERKIVAPPSRYRTASTSSTGSSGHRRRRTTSGSSTGSVLAANKPAPTSSSSSAKPAEPKPKPQDKNAGGGGGWLGGLFSKFGRNKNEMKLPDDKNPPIVWDSVNKRWVNKDGDGVEDTVAAPPPKDTDLMGKMPPPAAPVPSSTPAMNGPATTNRFSMQRGRGARGQYVDVLNPGGSSGSTAPPGLFNVLPGADNSSSNAGSTPQLFNPAGVAGGSASQSASSQGASSLAPPSHEAQEFGNEGPSKSTEPMSSQPVPSLPMMFNPAQLSQTNTKAAASAPAPAASGMKYGHRRVYPK